MRQKKKKDYGKKIFKIQILTKYGGTLSGYMAMQTP